MKHNSSILILDIYDYLINDNYTINNEILYKLRDLFYLHKNYDLFSLINQEITGTFNSISLPNYRKTNSCETNGNSGARGIDYQLFTKNQNVKIGVLCKLKNEKETFTGLKDIHNVTEKDRYVLLDGDHISHHHIRIDFLNIIINFKKHYLKEVEKIINNNFEGANNECG